MDTDLRIAQWEHMTQADPQNDMGWFSLGSAYRDAQRLEDAERALAKCLELNPEMSRAYQLRAQGLIQLGREDEATLVLATGYVVAARKGDVMPQRAMGALLEKLGRPVPAVEAPGTTLGATPGAEVKPLGADQIIDRKTGQVGTKLAGPPLRSALGRLIVENFSQETWREWIRMGTKVINEFRLDFSNPAHEKIYDQQMMEWLGVTAEELQEYEAQLQGKKS